MKNSTKTAFSGITVALSVTVMLAAYFPFATYAVPALSGILFAILNIEVGRGRAFCAAIAASLLSLLLCEKESATLFVFFFSWYPIVKGIIEQHLRGALEWLVKLLVFNAAVIAAYAIIIFVFSIPLDESGNVGFWFTAGLLFMGNVVFAVYDFGLTRVIGAYIFKLHDRVRKMLGGR